jgi:hypothetical protein
VVSTQSTTRYGQGIFFFFFFFWCFVDHSYRLLGLFLMQASGQVQLTQAITGKVIHLVTITTNLVRNQ